MAIDTASETLISISEYTEKYRLHKVSGYRHTFPGVNGVRLETVQVGRRVYTSLEAAERFFARLSEVKEAKRLGTKRPTCDAPPAPTANVVTSPGDRRRRAARATAELAKHGV